LKELNIVPKTTVVLSSDSEDSSIEYAPPIKIRRMSPKIAIPQWISVDRENRKPRTNKLTLQRKIKNSNITTKRSILSSDEEFMM
jgi:hypothetical protein